MSFIDPLTLILNLLVLVAVTVFYTGLLVLLHVRRRGPERAQAQLEGGALLLGLLGAGIAIIVLWGEFTWPLPGSYNLFFFDPLALLAVVLVGFAIAVRWHLPTHFVGIVSLVSGAGVIFYGARAYQLGLTNSPLEAFLLYLGFGGAAILAYPATLFVDWYVTEARSPGTAPLPTTSLAPTSGLWIGVLGLFMVVLVLAGIAAIFFGFSAAWSHLANPP